MNVIAANGSTGYIFSFIAKSHLPRIGNERMKHKFVKFMNYHDSSSHQQKQCTLSLYVIAISSLPSCMRYSSILDVISRGCLS